MSVPGSPTARQAELEADRLCLTVWVRLCESWTLLSETEFGSRCGPHSLHAALNSKNERVIRLIAVAGCDSKSFQAALTCGGHILMNSSASCQSVR